MAKTLLNGVNEVFKRMSLIQGDANALTTLTDSARQTQIDKAVQVWNEVMEEMYSRAEKPLPQIASTGTLTLVTDDRDYALASDLVEFLWNPLPLDTTNGRYLYQYPGGYEALYESQLIPADYTGIPLYGAIRPTDGQLYLDRIPTSAENGNAYTYHYVKDASLSAPADTFPFSDAVFRALVPAIKEKVSSDEIKQFNVTVYNRAMGTAARLLNTEGDEFSWSRRS